MSSYSLSVLSGLLYDQLDGNTGLYPQAQITQVLNNGVRKINFLTGVVEDTVQMITGAGQLLYQMDPGMIFPTKMYIEGIEIEKYSLLGLGRKYRNWMTDTTANLGPIARWAPIGIDQYVLHPMDSVGGQLIEADGVVPITAMVNPNDTVDLDDDQVPTLIDYCRGRSMLKLGGSPFASASASYQRFIKEIRDMVIWQEFTFPKYYIEKQLELQNEKGT